MTIPFIEKRFFGYAFSAVLVIASIVALATWKLPLGVDFEGGSMLMVAVPDAETVSVRDIKAELDALEYGSFSVQQSTDGLLVVRSAELTAENQRIVEERIGVVVSDEETIRKANIVSSAVIGPTIGSELRRNAVISIVFVLFAIVAFVSWAFRKVSEPVSSWKYGVIAILALAHDVIITTGVYAAFGHFFGAEVDTLFVTALLTVLGFSVHDTIVVFDRTRENLKTHRTDSFDHIVNSSINQTLGRSISTSVTTLIVLGAIVFFGGTSIYWFVMTLIIGIIIGTYSSIFVASPLLVDWQQKR